VIPPVGRDIVSTVVLLFLVALGILAWLYVLASLLNGRDHAGGRAADRAMSTEVGVIVARLLIFVVLAAVMIWRRGGPHDPDQPEGR
jgi:hypothetical protein